jgi:CubicO group peptidase (beta-lactamase class C family)
MQTFALFAIIILPAVLFSVGPALAESLDDSIAVMMQKRHIAGLSLAVIQNGEIVKATGYGFTDESHAKPVTPDTLFQAASVSKPVAAMAALRFAEAGKLSLDADVNTVLQSWRVPENEFTKDQKVTLRRLLSHTAGLTVHGCPGYVIDDPLPALDKVLNGEKPANTPPIRVDAVPGAAWRYSGGGYTVLQQMLIDVSGRLFPELLQQTVLKPLGMQNSTYEQPLPAVLAPRAATGHGVLRQPVKGRWHVYPEMAAAGLWTTPSDLARFAIGLQQSLAERPNAIISPAMAREMLTVQKASGGLGVFLSGSGKTRRFEHGGGNAGFRALLVAYAETGQGAVVMINADDDSPCRSCVLEAVAQAYHWPDYPLQRRELEAWKPHVAVHVDAKILDAYVGEYQLFPDFAIKVTREGDQLMTQGTGQPKLPIFPEAETEFFARDVDAQITFVKNAAGRTTHFVLHQNGKDVKAPKKP